MRAKIAGTGMYVPPTVVPNEYFARIMDTSDEWIRVRTGIEERRFADPEQATSDVAVPAAQMAIENAGFEVSDIDYVVFATMTPDHYFPGSAAALQHKLGLEQIPCLDIRQQCAGFVYALQLADAMIRAGQYRKVLVVGAEVHACLQPWNEQTWDVAFGRKKGPLPEELYAKNTETRDRTILFGDGAGAMVLTATDEEETGILDVLLHTNGKEMKRLWTPAAGSAFRPYIQHEMIDSGDVVPIVEGRKVYALAVTFMPQVTEKILARNSMVKEDLDLVIMHQANLRINEAVQKRLGLPDERVFNNIQRYGNTTAATIPIAFHEALEQGKLQRGDLICLVGLGSGLNWGAVLVRY